MRINILMSNISNHALAVLTAFLIGIANSHAGGERAFSDHNWTGMNRYPGINGDDVYAAVADGSGNLYVSGNFDIAGDVFANGIARWNGTNWSALVSEPQRNDADGPDVYALAGVGAHLYVGGWFRAGDAYNLAKWDGSSWSELGSGVNGRVTALAASETDLLAAGYFTTAGGKVSPYFAQARIGSFARSVAVTNSTASVRFSGVTGYDYDVQRTTNVNPPIIWTTINACPLSPAPDGSFTFIDNNAPSTPAFFRAARRGSVPFLTGQLGVQQPCMAK